MRRASSDSEAALAALVMPGGLVVRCLGRGPVCGGAMTGRRTSACADKCQPRRVGGGARDGLRRTTTSVRSVRP